MKCPFTFSIPNKKGFGLDCDHDCALCLSVYTEEGGVEMKTGYTCALAALASDKPENVTFMGLQSPIWSDHKMRKIKQQ